MARRHHEERKPVAMSERIAVTRRTSYWTLDGYQIFVFRGELGNLSGNEIGAIGTGCCRACRKGSGPNGSGDMALVSRHRF